MRRPALLVLCVLAPLWASAEPGPAEAVLRILTGADRARSALADERSRWALERDRQTALADALEAEARRTHARAAQLDTQAAALSAETPLVEIEARISEREQRAAAIGRTVLDGLAPLAPRWAAPETEPGLAGALALLQAAEHAAEATELAVQTALDPETGDEVAVQTLRLGLVSMWWRSLDGRDAGVINFADGVRRLRRVDARTRRAVAAAMAVAAGQRAPQLVDLPLSARAVP